MKKIKIRRLGIVLAVLAAIVAMNTVVFAATTTVNKYNVSISGITRNDYSYSASYLKNYNEDRDDIDYAILDDLTGASSSLGVSFLVNVENSKDTSYCSNTGNYNSELTTKLSLKYQKTGVSSYRIKVIQTGYARVSSATLTTTYTP